MRISSLRKYWISIISLLAMLVSAIASGSPMNAMEMMTQHHQPVVACEMKEQIANPHAGHTMMTESSAPDCGSAAGMDHNCCPATCFSAFALFTDQQTSPVNQAKLALMNTDLSAQTVYQPQSLYRPPIS
ncbi:hypothetical protein K6Q96_10640 [Grimontia kaedaensis]|uniref:CopL family metal-binding regulatory protein n=1 Tax=Grimontia kaedaensis TaxID=2872157 RepID=A0ABY4WQB0_9GAMM|nr:hypothetical protein [Grimontia kaedaensis]USH01377.1 hypothetical protein K6Q96_10640 [Grimontia kaedaensis]